MIKEFVAYRLAGDGLGGVMGLEAKTLVEWWIPAENPNWKVYQEWLEQGNTPLQPDAPWPTV